MTQPLSPEEIGKLFQAIDNQFTTKLSELAKIAGLSLAEDYIGADLSDEDLSGDNLSHANLSNANLSNANLSHTDLSYVNLTNADLSSANLSYANLNNADLSNANLTKANLFSATLSHANLNNANLSHTDCRSTNLLHVKNLTTANVFQTFLKIVAMEFSEKEMLTLKQRGAIIHVNNIAKNLNEITKDSDLQDSVFKLIQTVDAEGLLDLIHAARKENTGNSQLEVITSTLFSPEEPSTPIQVIPSKQLQRHYRETNFEKKSKYLPHRVERYDPDDLLGRKESLASLNRWVVDTKSEEYKASIYVIVASSGMGKSLLAWKWFDSITDRLWKKVTWWSLYQKEDFDIFLKLALVNLIGKEEQEISDLNTDERTLILLENLKEEPFLLVLDGLEYALVNEESRSIALDRHTIDLPIEIFLAKFRKLDKPLSRILITTTFVPNTLVRPNGEARENVYKHGLSRLSSDEAIELWKGVGLSIPRGTVKNNLLSLIKKFDYHPLFIRALAGEVKQDIRSGGNFQIWWDLNRRNHLGQLRDISDWMSNLLNKKLGRPSKEVLLTISAFYCPCRYNVLSTLMLERGFDENKLSNSLHDLEARGLINRISEDDEIETRGTCFYRIHQLIIDAGWGQLSIEEQVEIATRLFNILIENHYYNDAYEIFIGRLNKITFEREYNSQRVDLLEKLFPESINSYPKLTDKDPNIEHDKKAIAMASLARGYLISGQPYNASLLSKNHVKVRKEVNYMIHAAKGQYYLSYELYLLGKLCESEERIRDSLMIFNNEKNYFWQVLCLRMLSRLLMTRGTNEELLRISNQEQSINLNLSNIIDSTDTTDDMIDEIAHTNNPIELLNSVASEVNYIEKHLLELNTQAECHLSEQRYTEARNIITQVLSKNDYRLIQADALLLLAKIEQCEGNTEEAISAASDAYRKAWCNGPIYVYQQVLEQATNILNEYDRPYPNVD